VRTAVERDERLPVEHELDGHHCALRHGRSVSVVGGVGDLRILEDGGVELRGVFGLIVI
jgi:hypothetical protein